ncbi:unnamed protein product [Sympodiomycopsis kandeliae]
MSTPQVAPIPGVLILTTAPPLYIPTLLLASHIRHPLKETYPRLLAEQWVSHLSQQGIESKPALSEPVIWLKGVPSFPQSLGDDDDPEEDAGSEESDTQNGRDSVSPDGQDSDGNVWRGLKEQDRRQEEAVLAAAKDPATSLDQGTSVANLTVGQVTYLAPVPSGTSPLLSLALLHHLHSVLLQYFPGSSSATSIAQTLTNSSGNNNAAATPFPSNPTAIPGSTLASNFDLVYQVLQEMLDDGRPLTTEYNSLKGIVRGQAWWEELLGRMSQFTSSTPAPPPQISPLPWRASGVRYSRNEVYVDIVESLTGVKDRKGKAVGGLKLHVSIACRAKLSGEPDLALALDPSPNGPSSAIQSPAFHPCVRHRRWTKEGLLSFVPPDGDFELARFGMSSDKSHLTSSKSGLPSSSSSAASPWEKGIPFTLIATRSMDKESQGKEWTFEIRVTAKKGHSGPTDAENLDLSLIIDENVCSTPGQDATAFASSSISVDARTAVASRNSTSQSSHLGTPAHAQDDAGTWRYDARKGTLQWTIPRLGNGIGGPEEVVLKGTVTTSTSSSQSVTSFASNILTTYSLATGVPSLSGLKVASLQVHGVEYKPFKGVRGATRGHIEWRW